jgi:Fuc2NAc and GlcNAc transferase
VIGVLASAVGLAALLTWAIADRVRVYAIDRALLDVPNHRSSHSAPTPRGGGIAIVLVTIAGTLLAGAAGWLSSALVAALCGGGALVALVGWIDDRRGLPAPVRALVHVVAACWALAWLGGMPTFRLGAQLITLGWAGNLAALVGIVWMTNLYNFMDGIDGLAGGEAAIVCGFAGVLIAASGQLGLALVAWLLAASSAGFLALNWAPARLFMGDVGSGFLGFAIAVLAVASENAHALTALGWLTLSAVFIVDATATLVRRALHGERWYAAHRRHAYQRAVQAGLSHRRVTTVVLLVDLLLCNLAWMSWRRPSLLPAAVGLALLLTVILYAMVERMRPMYPIATSGPSARSR